MADSTDITQFSSDDDPKRVRVLESAMKVVLAYGYHRTTMDDVARASEMSRPSLYLLFKNKADIFRAVASRMFRQCLESTRASMAGDGSFGDRLYRTIDTNMIDMMCAIHQSPHGAELLDLKNQLAGDIVEEWHSAMTILFRDAIGAEAARRGVDLPERGLCADILAELLLDGLEGMKMRTRDPDAQRKSARQLVRVIEIALQP